MAAGQAERDGNRQMRTVKTQAKQIEMAAAGNLWSVSGGKYVRVTVDMVEASDGQTKFYARR